jgi:hypothetical protein
LKNQAGEGEVGLLGVGNNVMGGKVRASQRTRKKPAGCGPGGSDLSEIDQCVFCLAPHVLHGIKKPFPIFSSKPNIN